MSVPLFNMSIDHHLANIAEGRLDRRAGERVDGLQYDAIRSISLQFDKFTLLRYFTQHDFDVFMTSLKVVDVYDI